MFEGSGGIDPKPEPNRRYFYKNGTYYPYDGYDAFYATYTYTTGFPTISENGTYSAADFGFDGLRGIYNRVDGGYTQGYNDGYEQAQKLIEESSGAGWIFFSAGDYAFINVPGRNDATSIANVTDIADYSAAAESCTSIDDGFSDYIEDISTYANKATLYGLTATCFDGTNRSCTLISEKGHRDCCGNNAYIVDCGYLGANSELTGIGISSIGSASVMLLYRDDSGNLYGRAINAASSYLSTKGIGVYLCRGIVKTSFSYEGYNSTYGWHVYRGPTPSELYASSTFWSKRSAYYGG